MFQFLEPDIPVCKGDEFQCSTGECIKFFQRCDMVVDCPNSEDESFCRKLHNKKYTGNLFSSYRDSYKMFKY